MNKYQGGEEEGESITLTDSSNMNVVELSISGNSVQETREGYNRIEVNTNNYTTNGITVTNNGDGSLTLNGTNTSGTVAYIRLNADSINVSKDTYFNLTKDKNYYMDLCNTTLPSGISLIVRDRATSNPYISATTSSIKTWTSNTTEQAIAFLKIEAGVTLNNLTIRPMIAESDVELDYEAYGAMPSPLYPSKVETVNTQVNIVVENEDGTEQQTKVVDIQQEMLEGDYFVKEEDGWKEVHGWNKQVLNGTQNVTYFDAPSKEIADSLDTTYFSVYLDKSGENDKTKKDNIKSNYFKNLYSADKIWGNVTSALNDSLLESIALQESLRLRIKKERLTGYTNDLTNTEKVTLLNNYLQQQYNSGNPVYAWYKLATPTKLACTEKQNKQLDDLLNTSTYKNVTHIYSTDKVSPVIKIKYRKDIETILNNQKNDYDTRLSNIEKLLSTTTTSALLLDNLQTDLEKEVL